jgi:archaellin
VSRTAGAVLLAALIAAAVLAAVLIPSGGGSSKSSAAGRTTPASRGEVASANGAKPAVDKRITLRPSQASSQAVGVALVLSESGKHAFYLAAEHMAPSKGFFYAVWLYNSATSSEPLGKSPPVSSNGRLQGGALLPSNASKYSRIVVTRETNEHPSKPGPIVLSGAFALH